MRVVMAVLVASVAASEEATTLLQSLSVVPVDETPVQGQLIEEAVNLNRQNGIADKLANGKVCTRHSDCTSDRCAGKLVCKAKDASTDLVCNDANTTCSLIDRFHSEEKDQSLKQRFAEAKCISDKVQDLKGKDWSMLPELARIAGEIVSTKQVCMDMTIHTAKAKFKVVNIDSHVKLGATFLNIPIPSSWFDSLLNSCAYDLMPIIESHVDSKIEDELKEFAVPQICVPLSVLTSAGLLQTSGDHCVTRDDVVDLLDKLRHDDTRKDFFNEKIVPGVNNALEKKLTDIEGIDVKKDHDVTSCDVHGFWPMPKGTCLCKSRSKYGTEITAIRDVATTIKLNNFEEVSTSGPVDCLENCDIHVVGSVSGRNMKAKGSAYATVNECSVTGDIGAHGSITTDVDADAGLSFDATYTLSGR